MRYFEAFGESGFHTAFMTTYSFGAQAFEDVPLPRLRSAGCRNICVLVDRQMANLAFTETGPPMFAGSSYHLIKIDAPAAFHPKITLLLGAKKGRLMIGSANLTAPGLGGNKELIASIAYSTEQPDFVPLFARALEYISRYVPDDDPWFSSSLDRARRWTPWINTSDPSFEIAPNPADKMAIILDRPGITIKDQIAGHIGDDQIERLIVLSPFWDKKLEGLRQLRETLGGPPTDLLIENERSGFPKNKLGGLQNTQVFDAASFSDNRPIHAKLFIALGQQWDHVISGSINCSYPALLGLTGQSGNAEAGVYRRVPRGTTLDALDLSGYTTARLEADEINEIVLDAADQTNENNSIIDGGEMIISSGQLRWAPPNTQRHKPDSMALFIRDGERFSDPLSTEKLAKGRVTVDLEVNRPKYGILHFLNGSSSAPVQIVDLDILPARTQKIHGGRKKKLLDSLDETQFEDLALIEILSQLETLDLEEEPDPSKTHIIGRGNQTNEDNPSKFSKLPYQEFVRARVLAQNNNPHSVGGSIQASPNSANYVGMTLNRLIGLVGPDHDVNKDDDLIAKSESDFSLIEPQIPEDTNDDFCALPQENAKPSSAIKTASSRATAAKIKQAVDAFEKRCQTNSEEPVGTAELVRLRALLHIILAYAQPTVGEPRPSQVLPPYTKEGSDWPRLIGRLLMQHFGNSPLVQRLHVTPDENEQRRVVEYFATASWAAKEAVSSVKINIEASVLRKPIERLAEGIEAHVQRYISSDAADSEYFQELTEKMGSRYGCKT